MAVVHILNPSYNPKIFFHVCVCVGGGGGGGGGLEMTECEAKVAY